MSVAMAMLSILRRGLSARWLAACLCLLALGPFGLARALEAPSGLRIEMTDENGAVLADPRGRSLYTSGGDRKPGESACQDGLYTHARGAGSMSYELPEPHKRPACSATWPPYLAEADALPVGDFTLVRRDTGARQWAYKGKPLYTYIHDRQPGELNGMDGAGRVLGGRYPAWAPLDAPRGVVAATTEAGRVLMTEGGKVLYFRKSGGLTKASTCSAGCPDLWSPLAAPAIGRPPKDWSIVQLGDGERQWAYQGRPLFTFSGDSRFAEMNGRDEPGWAPLAIQPRLAPPPELSIQVTADGEVYADSHGMTVYSWGCNDEGPDRALCDIPGATQTYRLSICGAAATCVKTWKPVLASKGAKPVGRTWSIVLVDPSGAEQYAAPGQKDALRVWAYRGRPIYTFARDAAPGDINGYAVTSGFIWGYGVVRADGALRRGF